LVNSNNNQLIYFLVLKINENNCLNLLCISTDAAADNWSKYLNNWSHKSLGLVDNINFVFVKFGIFHAIDAETATWVVIYFNLSVLFNSFGVLSNTDSKSNVAIYSYLKSKLGML